MQWLSSRHVKAATGTHATTEELLEGVFSVRSVLRLQNESRDASRETRKESVQRVCRRSVESCGQFGNLEEGECPPLEAATKQRLVKTVTENTSLCVIVTCKV
jgi:hypothetical protein